jgi:hypothetical protein
MKPDHITMTQRQKQQSMEWRHSGSTHPKKFRVQKPAGNIFTSIFGDQDGILHTVYLPKGQTINAEYYPSLLVQLKNILKEKRRGKFTKGVLFLHNNAMVQRALATQKKLTYLGFNVLITHPILQIWPIRLLHVSWAEKTIEMSPFFVRHGGHSCRGDLAGWTTF